MDTLTKKNTDDWIFTPYAVNSEAIDNPPYTLSSFIPDVFNFYSFYNVDWSLNNSGS